MSTSAAVLQIETAVAVPAVRLQLGLSAVLEMRDGALSHWALQHAPGQPDFHHDDAFALILD